MQANLSKNRWAFLDAIRALAALGVLFAHGTEHCFPGYLQFSLKYGNFGLMGVVAFFLVTGFIIPVSLERYNSLPRFWMGRFFRLFPMYFASLVVCLGLSRLGLFQMPPGYSQHFALFSLIHLTLFQEFFHVPHVLGSYWTLAYELIFCGLSSCLLVARQIQKKERWAWITIVCYLAATLLFAIVFHRSLSAAKMGILVTAFYGALIYANFKGNVSFQRTLFPLPVLLLTFALVSWFRFTIYPKPDDSDQFSTLGSIVSFVAGYILFGAIYLLREHRFPSVLTWLGRISYSLYLVHGIVLRFVPDNSGILGLICFALVSVVISHVTYTFIEKPPFDFGHKFLNRDRPRKDIVQQSETQDLIASPKT